MPVLQLDACSPRGCLRWRAGVDSRVRTSPRAPSGAAYRVTQLRRHLAVPPWAQPTALPLYEISGRDWINFQVFSRWPPAGM